MTTRDTREQPEALVTDTQGNPVDVVERDIEQPDTTDTNGVDKVITPTSIKRMEQDVETLNRMHADLEPPLNTP
jgi:hypothetical protein